MINVLYSANDKYFKLILLSSLSMAKHTKEALSVYVMSMNCETKNRKFNCVKQEQIDYLTSILQEYNPESRAILVNVQDLYDKYLTKNKNKNSTYSPYTLLRLLSTRIKDLPSKIIYLDCDTMVYNDIKELYDVDVSNYEFGAVLDAAGHYFFGRKYCNAGVLLLNLDKIRETGLFDSCLTYVFNIRSIMPDQDALNNRCQAKLILPRKFNEQRDLKSDTVVKHFCKILHWIPYIHTVNIKQDDFKNVHDVLHITEFDDVFEEYNKLKEGHEELF